MEPLSKDIQKQILEAERHQWRVELELMSVRNRVAHVINDKQIKEDVKVEAEKCIIALDELDKMLEELQGQA